MIEAARTNLEGRITKEQVKPIIREVLEVDNIRLGVSQGPQHVKAQVEDFC